MPFDAAFLSAVAEELRRRGHEVTVADVIEYQSSSDNRAVNAKCRKLFNIV